MPGPIRVEQRSGCTQCLDRSVRRITHAIRRTDHERYTRYEDFLNCHSNAAALIIAAATKSGLLEEVARALYAFDNHYEPPSGVCCNFNCGPCELLSDLADAFDAHACLPDRTWESLTCEGCAVPVPESPERLATYTAIPLGIGYDRPRCGHVTPAQAAATPAV